MTPTATAEQAQAETGAGAVGRIARVTGPVVDIEFPHESIPDIYNALTTTITLIRTATIMSTTTTTATTVTMTMCTTTPTGRIALSRPCSNRPTSPNERGQGR